jgi:hypothetical protein
MTSAAVELQKAVFATLGADMSLTAAMGGGRIHDHAPANVAFPHITFGRTSIYDWSTGTEDGSEHIFTVHVWSKAKGKVETLGIMDAVKKILDDAGLELAGHRLVNLRKEYEEARFDEDLSVYHGILRFRAVTEPTD